MLIALVELVDRHFLQLVVDLGFFLELLVTKVEQVIELTQNVTPKKMKNVSPAFARMP